MKQEDKELLLKDLCVRLPYGVKVTDVIDGRIVGFPYTLSLHINVDYANIRPYLRPMSSMTEEEKEEYCNLQAKFLCSSQYPVTDTYELFDWLNRNHFDYRGLIPKGLAIEVTDENNPYKEI